MIKTEKLEYFMLNETVCDLDVTRKNIQIIQENVFDTPAGGKLYTLSFDIPVTVFGKKNYNGRVYDRGPVMKAWDTNVLLQNDMKGSPGNAPQNGKSRLCGEYGHPEIDKNAPNGGLARQMTILPTMASHTIDKYWEKDNVLMNRWTTLAGGYGNILRDRIITGFPAMASTRSVGGVDSSGHVLPGFILVTVDAVMRPSEGSAVMVDGTQSINQFKVPAGQSMSESAVMFDYNSDALKSFLMDESVSRDKIARVCDTMKLDYDSMVLVENTLQISRVDGNERTTVYMPLNKLIGANMYHLFN